MSTVLIGVGNRDRGDDAAGLLVVEAVDGRLDDVVVVSQEGDMAHLPLLWGPDDDVVIVDALVDAGSPAGELRVLAAADLACSGAVSTHGVGVAEALALADRLGRRPRSLTVVGVTVTGVGTGPVNPRLRRRIPALADRLAELVADDAGADSATDIATTV